MFSRAHLLIGRQLEDFHAQPPWGIEVWPLHDEGLFELIAKIKGLKDTPWEGGIFKLYVKFDEHYDLRPPEMFFQTIPFHPNVEVNTGRPCVDFLDQYESWNPDYSLSLLLTSTQALLSNPVVRNAVNTDAAQMMLSSPQSYIQMVLECVAASQRVEAGVSPQIANPDSKVRFASNPNGSVRTAPTRGISSIAKLSFDDYHNTWCGIATSKTKPDDVNSLLQSIKGNKQLEEVHMGLPKQEVEEQIRKQMEDHHTLMYGLIKNKPGPETARREKMAQLERMKKIYLPPRQSPGPPIQDIHIENTLPALQGKEETLDGWEKEVDDLVSWTNNLDSNSIDAT